MEADVENRASLGENPASAGVFVEPRVEMVKRSDGAILLRSCRPLPPYPRAVGKDLVRWAEVAPDRLFLAQRQDGGWRKVTYRDALQAVRSIGQALLDRGLTNRTPVMLVAENGIDHALLVLGAMHVGIPASPVSTAYSRLSHDYAKLKHIIALLKPGVVYVDDAVAHKGALGALDLHGAELAVSANRPPGMKAIPFDDLAKTRATEAVDRAFAALGPDTVAKVLFTSGSTGMPKGVINTHRMLTANQTMASDCWPFLAKQPLVLVDWLPWNHTYGGNHNFNLVLRQGGTLWIDDGKPAPGLIERTVANLHEISPTVYFNVPRGYALLLDCFEADTALAEKFFDKLVFLLYAGAALPQALWLRLERLILRVRGRPLPIISSWGLTETAPMATTVLVPLTRAGNVGVPVPGCELKLVPEGDKLEARVRGPNVTPGYWQDPERTKTAFDEEGFYRTGDAVRLADPDDPSAGILFDGRIGENFKLMSGTWVNVGELRVAAIAALAPLAEDLVVTGHDRDEVGAMIFPSLAGCRRLCPHLESAAVETVIADPVIRAAIAERLKRFNAGDGGSASKIVRVLLLSEPPSQDANEITDKGYLNQRAILERRVAWVGRLYAEPLDPVVIRSG